MLDECSIAATDGAPIELLPADSRTLSARIDGVWPLVAVGASIHIEPAPIALSGEQPPVASVDRSLTVWAVPLSQLLLAIGLILMGVSLAWQRGRSRRRIAMIVVEAPESGRREALSRAGDAASR